MDTGGKNSVLVVDDDKSNLLVLNSILHSEYTVYTTITGVDAVDIADTYLPDLILLDVLMPEMSGYDVIAKLKSSEKTRNIPVIFITGLESVEDEEKGLDLGAVDFIRKPFSEKIVCAKVRTHMRIVNLSRALERFTR